jgi:transposase-like protein
MNACENILRLSRDLGIHRSLLYKWRDQVNPADAEAEAEPTPQDSRESDLLFIGRLRSTEWRGPGIGCDHLTHISEYR